jgi:glycosyltransferase involved in cell wall biosynthesis
MRILLFIPRVIPVIHYGGAPRILWWLGKELSKMGHDVTYLVDPGSSSPYGRVIPYNRNVPLNKQIPGDIDFVHLFYEPEELPDKPYLVRILGNTSESRTYDVNTVFLTRDHAARHNSRAFVYNGIDPDDYGVPDLTNKRTYFHFLGKAAWRLKNVRGAIRIARDSGNRLAVIGGRRINIKMGFRVTLDPGVRFHGMLGGKPKNRIINGSQGLIFPVLWHEPFGIAIIESLYFGCPVFGTPYGSLPELVTSDVGFLSDSRSSLTEAVGHAGLYDRKRCHQYVMEHFTSKRMAKDYLALYEKILNGEAINPAPPCIDAAGQQKFLPFYA